MSLTVSYCCCLSLTVSYIAVSHSLSSHIESLHVSHCLIYRCCLLSPMVAGCLPLSPLLLLAVSHCLLYGCWLSLTVSYIVAGFLSLSLWSRGVASRLSLSPVISGSLSLSSIVAGCL